MIFLLGSETIELNVVFRKRKTLCIQIRPPGEVTVISPIGKSEKEIRQSVKTKSKWIAKKLSEMKKMDYTRVDKQYVSGEKFSYLGNEYSLQIMEDEKYKRPKVEMLCGKIFVYTSNEEPDKIQLALENWYRKKALENITDEIAYYQGFFNVAPAQIVVKKQRKRWGSCTSKHKLLFNFKCTMLPLPILDYIVVHEMCHMVHLNHSKEFWNLVGEILPDYKQSKEWLKYNGLKYDL
jgi:predicted metal-dependent hydrolase